jgi:thiol-disulfide isomerase/thioredoxin
MKRSVLAYFVIGALSIAIGVYFGARQLAPEPAKSSAVIELMAQSLPDANGKTQRLDQWQGKILVVNFWATWCAPCVKEMPELAALQTELAGKQIQFLGIGIDSATNISEFASKYKITYPLIVAGMGGAKLTRAFGNQAGGLPYTVIIGRQGEVHKTYLGQLNMEELRRDLAAM